MRDFLWEGVNEGKCSYLVSWEIVWRSIKLGKLEIDNLRIRNKALLAKWLWQFIL